MNILDNTEKSLALFERAKKVIPGGVNSPVRAFKSVNGSPIFFASAKGAELFDVDGNSYIDYVGSWGPMILGHAPEKVLASIRDAASSTTSFGAPCELEVELAEEIVSIVSGIESVRMVNSGTEATMSAIRLARAATGREIIVKCDGCYHGHSDSLLVEAGSGVATYGIAGSPGVCPDIAKLTCSIPFNDLDAFERIIAEVGSDKIAALILEPVPGNMGLVLPNDGYLEGLRKICSQHGILMIFDEVMSGFRVALGGAIERFGVQPDLVTFGKVIGGGLPVGAFAGPKDLMSKLAPDGSVYQAGTLSGNPLAMSAGLATIRELRSLEPYDALSELTDSLTSGFRRLALENGVGMQTTSCGSMFGYFFNSKPVSNFADARQSDTDVFKKFFWGMLKRGVYLAPSAFEAGFVGTTHDEELVAKTLQRAEEVFLEIG